MPELPEMEVYRRHLAQHVADRVITAVEVGRPKSLNVSVGEFKAALLGQSFNSFERAGKHLILKLSGGRVLLNHLMLGGALFYGAESEAPRRTFQVIIRLDNGRALYWSGLRLGWLHLLNETELRGPLASLGVEPLTPDFTVEHVAALLEGRRGALKPLLVDQERFPGIGNCYSDESCWAARVHPLRKAGSLVTYEVERLWQGINDTLTRAIELGGYTETPFMAGDTMTGGVNEYLAVYDREGEPCHRCTTPIQLAEASSRKLFFCPTCQPEEGPAYAGPQMEGMAEAGLFRLTGEGG